MELRIVDERDVDAGLHRAIKDALCVCFPNDREAFSRSRAWHGSAAAYSVLLEDGGRIIAHAGVHDRTISVGDRTVRAAGVQNVFTLPTHRGRGLVRRILIAAMAEAARRGFDFGLLFCNPDIEKIYARIGWTQLSDRPTFRIDETGREGPLPGRNVAMYYPLGASSFPPGLIHLRGNDW